MNASNEIIFVVNPGSTSTKLAIFDGEAELCRDSVHHSAAVLSQAKSVWDQFDFRTKAVQSWMRQYEKNPAAVVSMGGLLKPLEGGTYLVDEQMLSEARANIQGEHASNLGCAIASVLGEHYHCPAYVVDPVSVDEFEPIARYSGHPLIQRRSLSHALNIHAVATRAADELDIRIADSSFVVAHLGGGVSVAAVKGGRIIDVNDASSDGPFSPERTGGLPLQPFIGLCYSGKHTVTEMRALVMGHGGLVAYLGSNSAQDVERRIAGGDAKASKVYEAMAYQIAKEIGAMAAVLYGDLNAVILTGGLAESKILVTWISERVTSIAPIVTYPGEDEMRALAEGALRVIRGEEQPKEYSHAAELHPKL